MTLESNWKLSVGASLPKPHGPALPSPRAVLARPRTCDVGDLCPPASRGDKQRAAPACHPARHLAAARLRRRVRRPPGLVAACDAGVRRQLPARLLQGMQQGNPSRAESRGAPLLSVRPTAARVACGESARALTSTGGAGLGSLLHFAMRHVLRGGGRQLPGGRGEGRGDAGYQCRHE